MALASDNSEKDSDTSRKDEGAEEESIDLDETETPAAASSEKAIEKTAKKHSLQADILAQVEQNQAKGNTSRYLEYSSEDWKRHSGEHTKEERKAAFSADIAAEICSGSAETIRDLHLEESFNWNACNTNGESYPHLVIQECNCFAGKQAREFSHISCPHKDKLESLIVKGASARVADDSGDTLLHIACKHGRYAVIAYLLKVAPELILFKNNSGLMPFANVPESSASELYDKLKRSVLAAVTQLFQTGGWTRMNIKDVKAIDGVGRAHGDGRTCVPDNNTTCMWLLATTKGDELNPEVRERLLNLTKQEVRDRLKVGKDASGDPSLAEVQAFAASLGVHVQVPFQQDSLVYILGRSTGIFLLLVAIHFENGETDYHALHLRANHHIIHDNTKGMKAVQFTDKDIQSEASAGLMLLEAFGKGERQAGDVKSIRLVATRQFLSDKEEADLKVVKAKKAKKTKTKMDNVQIDEIYWAFKELGGQPFSDAIERQQSNFHELYKNPKEKVTKKMLTTFLETKFGLPVDGANTPNFYDCLKCEEPGIQVYVIQVHYKMDGKESSETRALVFQVSKSEYGLKKYLYNNNTSEAMRLLTEDLSTKNGVSNAFEARLPSRRDGYKYKYVRTELNWAFKFRNE
ncbi:expressed unknown protein [Seminavis robusta]|uniref:Uncharacterized protein n=1 Tax=Seminavis robusta TaxID=568900 RepID=A0A9N8EXH1_9STRA|nr:expressed unknown protein [Seminavis robusta]|eukprot:Sro2689_g334660.1 n/a (634) ;mRNA; f:3415-5475